jgi:hypothetical protein
MTTVWTPPSLISQYAEPSAEDIHIPWNALEFSAVTAFDQQRLGLNGVLSHIARSPKHDTLSKTYFLKFQGFNFKNLPDSISGVEVKLCADRRGRVTDDTVQLIVNNAAVGSNKANLNLDPIKYYGSPTDKWEVPSLSTADLANSNFGLLLRFKSHPNYPHSDPAFINSIELRIY